MTLYELSSDKYNLCASRLLACVGRGSTLSRAVRPSPVEWYRVTRASDAGRFFSVIFLSCTGSLL